MNGSNAIFSKPSLSLLTGKTDADMPFRLYSFTLLLILLTGFACSIPAFAGDQSSPIQTRPVLRAPFCEFPPARIATEHGGFAGRDVELLRIIASRMNMHLQITAMSFRRALDMLRSGDLDIAPGLLRTDIRESYLIFLEPPYEKSSDKAFYVLKNGPVVIEGYEDLRPLHIGTLRGVRYFPQFDADESLQKEPVATHSINFEKLLNRRIDTFIETESVGDYRVREGGLQDRIDKATFRYTLHQDIHMVLSKRSPLANKRKEFERVISEIIEDGSVQAIQEHPATESP